MVNQYRRRFLKTASVAGVTGLAGCTDLLNGEDSSTTLTPTDTPVGSASYGINTDESIDFTETDDLELHLERNVGEETELLEENDVTVKDAHVIRNHSKYNEETLQEAGLYQEIQEELEYQGNGEWALPDTAVLAGNTTLNIEIETDGQQYQLQKQLTVQKNPEETLQDTWIEDQELFQQLRTEYTQDQLDRTHTYNRNDDVNWGGIAEKVKQTTEEKYDLEDMDKENRIQRYAYEWINQARDAIGMEPSSQAIWLARTKETIFPEIQATSLDNNGHNTTLGWDKEQEKMRHTETARGGNTVYPPANAGWPRDNPDETPLWGPEDNLEQAIRTHLELIQLSGDGHEGYDVIDEFGQNIRFRNGYLEDSMITFREGGEPEQIEYLNELGLSAELSPSVQYTVDGTATDPETTATV